LKEGVIPPQPGMPNTLNRKFPPLDKMNVRISQEKMAFKPYPKGDGKRKIFLNNFDAAVRFIDMVFNVPTNCLTRAVILVCLLKKPPNRDRRSQIHDHIML
jgi:hypothetical protein